MGNIYSTGSVVIIVYCFLEMGFWRFEKANVQTFLSDRPDKDINDYLTQEEVEAITGSLKYGTTEYLQNSLLFKFKGTNFT